MKRWRDGEMALRWAAAGMEAARDQFRRVKGYRQLPELAAKLEAATADQPDSLDVAVQADGIMKMWRRRHQSSTEHVTSSDRLSYTKGDRLCDGRPLPDRANRALTPRRSNVRWRTWSCRKERSSIQTAGRTARRRTSLTRLKHLGITQSVGGVQRARSERHLSAGLSCQAS